MVIQMSLGKRVELREKIRHLGGDSLDVKVRFNYLVNGEVKSVRKNYTIHAETKDELRDELKKLYESNRADSSKVNKTKKLVEDLSAEDFVDITE